MKRRFLLMLPLALCACEPTPEQSEQNEASKNFELATQFMDNAQSSYKRDGSIEKSKLNHSKAIGNQELKDQVTAGKPQLLSEYQRAELNKAITPLKTLTSSGSVPQQVASLLALGQIHASNGRQSAKDGIIEWATSSMQSSKLSSLLMGVRTASNSKEAYLDIYHDEVLQELKAQKMDSDNQAAAINKAIATLNEKKASLEAEIKGHEDKSTAFKKESGEAKRKAFTAKGKDAFELNKAAAIALKNADHHSAEINKLNAQLDVIDSELAVNLVLLTQHQNSSTELQDAITNIEERITQNKAVADKFSKLAEERLVKFKETLTEATKHQTEVVDKTYANVVTEFDAAITNLTSAVQRAGRLDNSQGKTESLARALFQLADISAQKGQYLNQHTVVQNGFAEMVKNISAGGGVVLDEALLGELKAMQTKAEEAAAASKAASIESLTKAAENYRKAADEASSSKDSAFRVDAQSESLTRLANTYDSLAEYTGDENHKTKAAAAKDEISKIKTD